MKTAKELLDEINYLYDNYEGNYPEEKIVEKIEKWKKDICKKQLDDRCKQCTFSFNKGGYHDVEEYYKDDEPDIPLDVGHRKLNQLKNK